MTKIKICGLTTLADIEAVNRWLPDYIGLVFCPSRRQVTAGQAMRLKEALDRRIKVVGVFVNSPWQHIVNLYKGGVIDAVQLHGDEDYAYMARLRENIDCPVIKAVRVRCSQHILQAEKLPCDMLLLDSFCKGQYGGSGTTFDHQLIPHLSKPFILAGGLNTGNIAQAIERCGPFAVDVSSGAETDGKKDEDKIRRIIMTVRGSGQKTVAKIPFYK
jgi:phosphoribosylanthranilate isomerase